MANINDIESYCFFSFNLVFEKYLEIIKHPISKKGDQTVAQKKSIIQLNEVNLSTIELTDVFNLNYSYNNDNAFSLEESKNDFEKIFNANLSDINIHTGDFAEELAEQKQCKSSNN